MSGRTDFGAVTTSTGMCGVGGQPICRFAASNASFGLLFAGRASGPAACSRRVTLKIARVLSVSATACIAIGAWVAMPTPAHADDLPTIQILSPTAGSTVGGRVTVDFVVTFPADSYTHSASVSAYPPGSSAVSLDFTGQDCTAGCEGTVTIDTTGDTFVDGSGELDVDADWDGGHVTKAVKVTFDNQRPQMSISGVDSSGVLTADKSLDIDATITPRMGGQISSADLVVGKTVTPLLPPTTPGGPWTYRIDTSAMANGAGFGYLAYIQARDDRGLYVKQPISYVVDHGPTVGVVTAVPDPVLDNDIDRIVLSYTSFSTPTIHPTLARISTYLDGSLINTETAAAASNGTAGQTYAHTGENLPAGQHTLTYVLTDSRGATGSVDLPVDVVSTLSTTWTSGNDAVVLPGQSVTISAESVSTDPTSPIVGTDLFVDGEGVASAGGCIGGCGQTLTSTASVPFTTPGIHHVELDVFPVRGYQQTLETTVTVLPYAVGHITSTGPSTYGVTRTLLGTVVTSAGDPATGVPTALQRKTNGSWTTIASTTSSAVGTVGFSIVPTTAAAYRLLTSDVAGHFGGEAGPSVTLTSIASLAPRPAPRQVRRGKAFAVQTLVRAPAGTVQLQSLSRGRWRLVAKAQPTAHGVATAKVSAVMAKRIEGSARTVKLRWMRPAGGGVAMVASRTVSIRVLR